MLLLLSLLRTIVLCSPTWSGAHSEAQAGLESYGNPALTSCTLRLQGCTAPSLAHKWLISTEAFAKFLCPQSLPVFMKNSSTPCITAS